MGEAEDLQDGLDHLDSFPQALTKAIHEVRRAANKISDGVDELVGGHTRHKGAWREFQSWNERLHMLLGQLEDHGESLPVERLRGAMDSELQSVMAGRQKRIAEWEAEEVEEAEEDEVVVVVQPVEVVERDTTIKVEENADGSVTVEEDTTVRVVEEMEVVEVVEAVEVEQVEDDEEDRPLVSQAP